MFTFDLPRLRIIHAVLIQVYSLDYSFFCRSAYANHCRKFPGSTKIASAVNTSAQSMENKPRRASRRIQGLAPQIDGPPLKAVYLPPELKVAVLAVLDKRDLKTVRLVSKEWNALATRPLFDRVYISCREKDMEVFEKITAHPLISTGIRELVYDCSLFGKDMSIREYFWQLQESLDRIKTGLESVPFNCANDEINGFIQDYQNEAITDIYKRHIHDDFIVEGHKDY